MELGNTTNFKIYHSIDNVNITVYEHIWDGQYCVDLLGDLWGIIFPSVSNSTRLNLKIDNNG